MVTLLWIMVVVIVILVLGYFGLVYGLSSFMKPNNENDSINTIKQFLRFDFKDEYTIVKHISRNNHPDRPLNVSIQLSEDSFIGVLDFVANIENGLKETLSEDRRIKYVEYLTKQSDCFIKNYKASHINSDISETLFFSSNLIIDYHQRTLTYNETAF
jgi:hypothetical protein